MKNLLLLSVLGLAACTETRGVHGDWAEGAHFAPNSAVEFRARAARGEPGVFPAPSGYSVFTEQQRLAAGAAKSDGVIRQGTASSRTGLFSGPGVTETGAPAGSRRGTRASTRSASISGAGLSANPQSLPASAGAPIVTRQQAVNQATSTPQTFRISATSQITLTRIRGNKVVEKYLYVSKNGKSHLKQTTVYSPNAKEVTWLGWGDLPNT